MVVVVVGFFLFFAHSPSFSLVLSRNQKVKAKKKVIRVERIITKYFQNVQEEKARGEEEKNSQKEK